MSSITISAVRRAQVENRIKKYVSDWHLKLDSPEILEEFLSNFHAEIEWLDHAFLVRRVGHKAVLGLQSGWNACNDPFRAEIKSIISTASGAIVEQIWYGKCANDLVRPNGDIAVKASGKDFVCHMCMVVAVDIDGKITRIDEYYNKKWDDGIRENNYIIMT